MKVLLLLLSLLIVQSTLCRPASDSSKLVANRSLSLIPTSNLDKYVDKLYKKADINRDGTLSFTETYEMVLKIYIYLNRQASITPPNRDQVLRLFLGKDIDKDNTIGRDEFYALVKTIYSGALTRLVAHKVVTMIGAPVLAEYILRILKGKKWFRIFATTVVPDNLHNLVLSESVARSSLIVLMVMTLGNVFLAAVDRVLEAMLPKEEPNDILMSKPTVTVRVRGLS